ncbi:MAG: rhomboid family intramembrane serine protease [Bacteroidia bacterium]|nr:rhomboid family intramembrane serine protease [Bacteroidia bacterium]
MSLTELVLGISILTSTWAWISHPQVRWSHWGLSPYLVRTQGEWYRFITSPFFHADLFHLLLNGLVFYSFGRQMELYYGRPLYAGLLLVGAAGSGAATYFRYKDNPHHLSIGLSGVVNAVVFSFIVLYPKATLLVWFLPLPAWLFALLYLGYSVYEARRGQGYVNHWAHLGGAASGIIFALALYTQ